MIPASVRLPRNYMNRHPGIIGRINIMECFNGIHIISYILLYARFLYKHDHPYCQRPARATYTEYLKVFQQVGR